MNRVLTVTMLFLVNFGESRNLCSSSKLASKYVASFAALQTEDVVVEAKFDYIKGGTYRFLFFEMWTPNNGDVNYMDEISVSAGGDPSTATCFDGLVRKGHYLLLLRRYESAFVAMLDPFSIKKQARRQQIRSAWCEIPGNECTMKISRDALPPLVELFAGTNTLLKCRVSSSTAVSSIRWLKDGKDIVEHGGDLYAENGIYVLSEILQKGTSELVIYRSTTMHSGVYTCLATNEGGETTELKTRVSVGPESSLFGACPEWAADYCYAGSVCRGILDLPEEVICECQGGRTGARCQKLLVPDISREVSNPGRENKLTEQLHGLQATNVVLVIALICSVLVVVFLSFSLIKRRKNRSRSHFIESPDERSLGLAREKKKLATCDT